jgi:hypothetical protein
MGRRRNTIEPLNPDVRTLAKIGSILAHVEEFFGSGSHHFDKAAIDSLMADPDVIGWIEGMRRLALLPAPRSQSDARAGRG